MASWPAVQFGELLGEPVRNGIYKRKEFHGRGAKMVNMGELFAYPRLRAVPMKRVHLSPPELEKFSLKKGDLLFARRSLVAEGAGKCSIVLETSEPTAFESSIIRARPDVSRADPQYLYYFFNSPEGLYRLGTIRRQVAVAGITGSDLSRLEIPLPPLATQRRITQILGTLDDKIELNRTMSETLEAMARALFKSWFVDFDPVRAKMEGRWRRGQSLPGLPPHLYDLFPDRLVDSELGEIPEGWEVGTLGEVAREVKRTVRPEEIAPASPYIGLEHMPRRSITLSDWELASDVGSTKRRFEAGEILFGKLRPYFHKVGVAPMSGVCSTDIVVIQPSKPTWFGFVLGQVSSDAFVSYTHATSTGTKMPRTKWRDMASYQLALPPEPTSASFTEAVHPTIDRLGGAVHESRGLAVVRDTLIPTLVPGEIGTTRPAGLLSEACAIRGITA